MAKADWEEFRSRRIQIFDLDDTLVNTSDAYLGAFKYVAEKMFAACPESVQNEAFEILKGLLAYFSSSRPKECLEACFVEYSHRMLNPQITASEAVKLYYEKRTSLFGAYKGATEYLDSLKKHGCKLCIITNGLYTRQLEKLKLSGLEHYFLTEDIFASSDFDFTDEKPSPAMFNALFKRIGEDFREQSIFYGDKETDILAARLANVSPVLVAIKTKSTFDARKLQILAPDSSIHNWQDQ